MPDSLIDIGSYAFYDSGLRSITLPANLKSIHEYAFDCTPDSYTRKTRDSALNDVYVKGTFESWLALSGKGNLEEVGSVHLCFGEDEITSVTFPAGTSTIGEDDLVRCNGIEEITLPEGVKTLAKRCLIGTSITTLTLPASVASIGEYAFPSTLTELYYEGTMLDWASVRRDTMWASSGNFSVVRFTGGGEVPIYN